MNCSFCDTVALHKKLNDGKAAYFEVTLTLRSDAGWSNLGCHKPKYCPVCGKRLWKKVKE